MDTTHRARVIDLVLDAVDPRTDSDRRLQATEQAADADLRLAYTLTRGMTFGLLRFVRERHGTGTLGAVVNHLAHVSMTVLDEGHDHAG